MPAIKVATRVLNVYIVTDTLEYVASIESSLTLRVLAHVSKQIETTQQD